MTLLPKAAGLGGISTELQNASRKPVLLHSRGQILQDTHVPSCT